MNIKLVSFPRSGSCLLEYLIRHNIKIHLKKTHSRLPNLKGQRGITIVRDPFDSILSEVAMVTHYYSKDSIEEATKIILEKYLLFYRYFLENSEVVVLYESVISDPKRVTISLAEYFQVSYGEDISVNFVAKDRTTENHLATSKTSKTYQEVKKHLEEQDLSEQYKAYEKVVNMSCLII